ncbi:MAG: hypothetical protein ACOY3O_08615 [Thermodesulfobacteriota bacterium]
MKSILVTVLVLLINNYSIASELTANEIISIIQERYQSLENFSCDGTLIEKQYINDFNLETYKTKFTIKLRKPNYYLIHWWSENLGDERFKIEGAVWNDGSGAFLFDKNFNAYFSFTSDELAIFSATGISKGIASDITSLFFKTLFNGENWLNIFNNFQKVSNRENATILHGVKISTESFQKIELELNNQNKLLTKIVISNTISQNNEQQIESLKKQKEQILQNSEHFEEFYKDLSEREEIKLEEIIASIDELIENKSKLPNTTKVVRYEDEKLFSNLSTHNIPTEEFQFHVPPDIKFQGNKLEALWKNKENF